MYRAVVLCLCAASASSFRFKDSSLTSSNESASKVAGSCKVATIKNVCDCNSYSYSWLGYQCSGCKDNTKWGYGCDLDCPSECEKGCDFSGNCLSDGPKPHKNCKRNSRVEDKTSTEVVTNERSECQACEDGFYGLMCEHSCPQNCEDSAEGTCTRGGKCYQCKDGWYGQDCSSQCSPGCSSCVMLDNLVVDKDGDGEFLPAGHCDVQCDTDTWGPNCDKPCPENCKDYSGKASCAKETGICKKCQDHKWFGDNCENPCSDGCDDGRCEKANGKCEGDCKPGFWGDMCDQTCPEGTVSSCDRETGLPDECKEGSYPKMSVKASAAECETCPIGCKNGKCNQDGTCSEGCQEGKFGDRCDEQCPVTCIGACDAGTTGYPDGECTKCTVHFTGRHCHKTCHSTCATCNQRGDAVGPDDCTSCPADQPTVLEGSTCECIEGASRNEDGFCQCDEPADPDKAAFFELRPRKLCRAICRDGTREVFGNQESTCMTHKKYKAVIHAEFKGLEQGDCPDDKWQIPIPDSDSECIRKDFVDNILEG